MNVSEGFAWDSAINCLVSAKLGTATRAPQQTAAMSTSQINARASASAGVGYHVAGSVWGALVQLLCRCH
jgi:hypothetical protein